jgi:uncharacterized protein YbaR (Trm112 family)
MIAPSLLEILCCPESRQPVALADDHTVQKLNAAIAAGTVKNRAGQPVREKVDGALARSDGKYLYPIRQNIPVMLIDEAIPAQEPA